jgi:tripartite-type tricarboxylate transporter receptor subunit TctC
VPQVRAGSIKALAVTSPQRLLSASEIPTADEAGVRGFHFQNWHAIWAPRGTPIEVLARLNAAVRSALADPSVRKRLENIGQQIPLPEQQTSQALAAYQSGEITKWWPIIKAADIRGE